MKEREVVIWGKAEVRFRKVMKVPEDELEDLVSDGANLETQLDWDDVEDHIDDILSLSFTVDGRAP